MKWIEAINSNPSTTILPPLFWVAAQKRHADVKPWWQIRPPTTGPVITPSAMPRSNVQCSMDFGWLVWHPWIFLFGNTSYKMRMNILIGNLVWKKSSNSGCVGCNSQRYAEETGGGSSLDPCSPNIPQLLGSKSKQLLQVTTIHMSHPHRSDLICCDVRNVGIAYSNPWEWSSGDRGFQRFGLTATTRNLCSIGWVRITVIGYKNMMELLVFLQEWSSQPPFSGEYTPLIACLGEGLKTTQKVSFWYKTMPGSHYRESGPFGSWSFLLCVFVLYKMQSPISKHLVFTLAILGYWTPQQGMKGTKCFVSCHRVFHFSW